MKLKKITLLAFIGAVIFALESLFYTFTNSGIITLGDNPKLLFTIVNIITFIAWLFIALFFYGLFKKQK